MHVVEMLSKFRHANETFVCLWTLSVLTTMRWESGFAFEINRSIWAAFVSIEFCVAWLLSVSY